MKKMFLVTALVLGLAIVASAKKHDSDSNVKFAKCDQNAPPITAEEATAKVQAVLGASGYKINDIEARYENRGGGFRVDVINSSSLHKK